MADVDHDISLAGTRGGKIPADLITSSTSEVAPESSDCNHIVVSLDLARWLHGQVGHPTIRTIHEKIPLDNWVIPFYNRIIPSIYVRRKIDLEYSVEK